MLWIASSRKDHGVTKSGFDERLILEILSNSLGGSVKNVLVKQLSAEVCRVHLQQQLILR